MKTNHLIAFNTNIEICYKRIMKSYFNKNNNKETGTQKLLLHQLCGDCCDERNNCYT